MKQFLAEKCTDSLSFDQLSFWSKANFEILVANDGVGMPPLDTYFSIMYSEKYLYFVFDCIDVVPRATMTDYNAPLYDEEVVEFFFSPMCDDGNYLEIEFNHNNAIFCANIHHDNDQNSISFVAQNPIESIVKKDGDNWKVFGRIPAETFSKFDSKNWKFNAYRIKRDSKGDFILSAFSPTLRPNFHTPKRFADLILN